MVVLVQQVVKVSQEETLSEALKLLSFDVKSDGTVTIQHVSGSQIIFTGDGNVSIKAARNARVDAERYVFFGREGNEEAADDMTIDRIRRGDASAIKEVLIDRRLPHLLDRAVEAYDEWQAAQTVAAIKNGSS